MKNLMYLKNDFVSKESFSRENSQMGLRQYLSSRVRKFLSRGGKNSCVRHFSRRSVPVSWGGSQENVRIVSARGGGPKIGLLASVDI